MNGSFVFRNEGDGCLTGKYLNDGMQFNPQTECCVNNGKPDPADPYIGTYTATWVEDVGKHAKAELTIQKGPGDFYTLTWNTAGRKPAFSGKAMLCHGLLIGHYWD